MNSTYKQGLLGLSIIVFVGGLLWWNSSHQTQGASSESSNQQVSLNTPTNVDITSKEVTPAAKATASKSAQAIHDQCEGQAQSSGIFDCYTQVLHDYMVAKDAKQTLELLQQLNDLGGYAQTNCHPLSHKVGNIALHVYGSPLAAAPYYLPTCYSGYYHGLLEEYIATEPDLKTAVITACGVYDPSKIYFDWFQCTHGLGHGVMQYRQDDVLLSLKDCDLIDPSNSAREICYGGVFMENITTDAKTGHPSKFIKPEDPIYPCNIVEAKYKSTCYFLSSSMILRLNGYNFQAGFKSCDTAEAGYIFLCYQSMGRDISGSSQRSISRVNELCPQGSPQFIGDCYFGAVRDFINEKGEFDTAIPMCVATPEAYKSYCYNGMIFDLGLLKKGQDYVNVCNQLPQDYKTQCLNLKKA
jgi:hypothetical protein